MLHYNDMVQTTPLEVPCFEFGSCSNVKQLVTQSEREECFYSVS